MTLFMRSKFYLREPKMEEATFAVFRKTKKLYQVTSYKDFYALHMSAYEHGETITHSLTHSATFSLIHLLTHSLASSRTYILLSL